MDGLAGYKRKNYMKMKFSILFLVAFALAMTANADNITLNFTILPGAGGNPYPGNIEYGTYNGFSAATEVDGGVTSNIGVFCDDYLATTYFPSQGPIQYTTSTIASGGEFANDTVGINIPVYKVAAVLLAGDGGALLGANDSAGIGDLQYALWYLMEPVTVQTYTGGISAAAANDLSIAENDVSTNPSLYTADFNGLTIYTPTCCSQESGNDPAGYNNYGTVPQEFLSESSTQSSAVPEPVNLSVIGLILLVVVAIRKCVQG
jgi:hypothetical protein